MIVIRKYKDSDLGALKDLMEGSKINVKSSDLEDLIYLSFEDEKLIGAIKVEKKDEIWYLDYIYIDKGYRNSKIGDGLLRVAIDKLEKNGVKTLYFSSFDGYLMKRGFKKNKDHKLELDVENFFKAKCSCGEQNEV